MIEPENDVEMMVYTSAIALASTQRDFDVGHCARRALVDFRNAHPNGLKIKTDFIQEVRLDAFMEAANAARTCSVTSDATVILREFIAEKILRLT